MAEDSARTKMIKDAPVGEDMGPVKRLVKAGLTKGSELLDRLGLTQKQEYENKTKEEVQVKKRSGGSVKGYKAGGYVRAADGCVKRGKTRGKMV